MNDGSIALITAGQRRGGVGQGWPLLYGAQEILEAESFGADFNVI